MFSSDAGVTNGTGAQQECDFESSEYNSADEYESAKLGQVKEDDDDEVANN